jgi:hypothetical protein
LISEAGLAEAGHEFAEGEGAANPAPCPRVGRPGQVLGEQDPVAVPVLEQTQGRLDPTVVGAEPSVPDVVELHVGAALRERTVVVRPWVQVAVSDYYLRRIDPLSFEQVKLLQAHRAARQTEGRSWRGVGRDGSASRHLRPPACPERLMLFARPW